MTLRQKIAAEIARHPGDPAAASLAVCLLLDTMLDLAGNGWFDDDPAVLDAIAGEA